MSHAIKSIVHNTTDRSLQVVSSRLVKSVTNLMRFSKVSNDSNDRTGPNDRARIRHAMFAVSDSPKPGYKSLSKE